MQQSAESNIIQFHLTRKCTVDQSSHFCDCFLAANWIFHHNHHSLTKFHAGVITGTVCVVKNNSHLRGREKKYNTTYRAFGKYWKQARGLLNYRLNCWLKVICCTCQPNRLEAKTKHKTGGQTGASQQCGGALGHLGHPLESPLLLLLSKDL